MTISIICFGVILCSVRPVFASMETRQWTFRVYLDDAEIGSHRVSLTDFGEVGEIRTEAKFNVPFLFFSVYTYRHRNTERWAGECLQAIESETDVNGDRYSVLGATKDRSFVVSAVRGNTENQSILPECVTTFAYWDRGFLLEPRLLNTQTGAYVNVEVELIGADVINVRNELIPSLHYRLMGNNIEVDLWYSRDSEWLALESVTKGGRRLRYELT